MTPTSLRYLLIIVTPLLLTTAVCSESMPLAGSKELAYVIPPGWTYHRKDTNVKLLKEDLRLLLTAVPLGADTPPLTQDSVDVLVREMTQIYTTGAVVKEPPLVHLKGLTGSHATFEEASLVGKADVPGNWKFATSGLVVFSNSMAHFTVLANSLDAPLYQEAISIVTSLDFHDAVPGPTAVLAPAQDLKILFETPPLFRIKSGPTRKGYTYIGTSRDGFTVSVFVKARKGRKQGHKACADFYWEQSQQNPMVDQSTVVTRQEDERVVVSYRIRGELEGNQFDIPNLNLYFEHKRAWIDVHISKFPFEESDQVVLDTFVKSLKYGPDIEQDVSEDTGKPPG